MLDSVKYRHARRAGFVLMPVAAMPDRRSSTAAAPAPADLRRRILQASAELIETEGLAALSMREVARRAGVTHQAPYHHFADRESILAELVTAGFDELARRLALANGKIAAGRHAVLNASGRAYVGFAIDHPGMFRIMFRPELCNPSRFPAALEAGERAHGELERLVQLMHDDRPSDSLASTYWAEVHGLACLIVDGPIGQRLRSVRERRAHMNQTLAHFTQFVLGPEP